MKKLTEEKKDETREEPQERTSLSLNVASSSKLNITYSGVGLRVIHQPIKFNKCEYAMLIILMAGGGLGMGYVMPGDGPCLFDKFSMHGFYLGQMTVPELYLIIRSLLNLYRVADLRLNSDSIRKVSDETRPLQSTPNNTPRNNNNTSIIVRSPMLKAKCISIALNIFNCAKYVAFSYMPMLYASTQLPRDATPEQESACQWKCIFIYIAMTLVGLYELTRDYGNMHLSWRTQKIHPLIEELSEENEETYMQTFGRWMMQ